MSIFKVLSYNLWFDQYKMAERMAAIATLIVQHNPDVICLQEVTAANFAMLHSNPMLQKAGFIHWVSPDFSHGWYSTAIGSKWPFRSAPKRMFYPTSGMGRCLLITEYQLHGQSKVIAVATSHLESLNNVHHRAKQLQTVFETLRTCDNAIFCGDTNIDEECDQNDIHPLPAGWVDGWPSLHAHDGHTDAGKGFTFDATTNTMVKERDQWASTNKRRIRYDRFLVKLNPTQMRLKDMVIIGTSPIWGTTNVFPSDHFGLLAVFEFR